MNQLMLLSEGPAHAPRFQLVNATSESGWVSLPEGAHASEEDHAVALCLVHPPALALVRGAVVYQAERVPGPWELHAARILERVQSEWVSTVTAVPPATHRRPRM